MQSHHFSLLSCCSLCCLHAPSWSYGVPGGIQPCDARGVCVDVSPGLLYIAWFGLFGAHLVWTQIIHFTLTKLCLSQCVKIQHYPHAGSQVCLCPLGPIPVSESGTSPCYDSAFSCPFLLLTPAAGNYWCLPFSPLYTGMLNGSSSSEQTLLQHHCFLCMPSPGFHQAKLCTLQ